MARVETIGKRTSARGARMNASGHVRLDSIMTVAREILVRDGYAELTMRKVAKEAGISIGHLQHFIPTKEKLIEALFEFASDLYDEKYRQLVADLPADPRQRFAAIIDYLLQDATSAHTKAFHFEFWTIGLRHPGAKRVIDRMHRHHRQTLARLIGQINPALDERQCTSRALQAAAIIDGLKVHTDAPRARRGSQAEALEDIRRAVIELATTPPTG